MKFLLVLIFSLLSFLNSINAQEKTESINCIVLIDEVLTDGLTGELEFLNSDNIVSTIKFGYEYGEIKLSIDDYKRLQLLDNNLMLTMNMKYIDMENGTQKEYLYIKKLEVIDLRQRYIILRIYNCKNDNCSRVYLQTPRYHNPYPEPRRKKALNCKRYLAPRD